MLCALAWLLPLASAVADDISLVVTLSSVDDHVSVRVKNTGRDPARAVSLTITLADRSYEHPLVAELAAGTSVATTIDVDVPRIQGSYPVYALVHYRNGTIELSSAHVGMFNVRREAVMPHECPTLDRFVRSVSTYKLLPPADSTARLFVGPEYLTEQHTLDGRAHQFSVRPSALVAQAGTLQIQSSIFAVFERHSTRLHETAICRGVLTHPVKIHAHSLFPTWVVTLILVGSLTGSFIWHRQSQETSSVEQRHRQLLRCRAAFVVAAWSLFLLFYRLFPLFPDLALRSIRSVFPHSAGVNTLERSIQPLFLDSGNYAPFFHLLADPLYLYLLCAHYFFLRRTIPSGGGEDKLYSLIAVLFASVDRKRRALPIPGAAIAARAFLVKAVFLPLLGSWMLSTGLNLVQIVSSPAASGDWLYRVSYHSLLLIDVTVFCASYFLEVPRLRNQIRSVEPTLLGWFVCLACYPPLNDLLLIPIDHPLLGYAPDWGGVVRGIVSTIIIALWAIYVWATLALGWKASNLTHRGIVKGGPYRFCRHPAYAAKLTIWLLSGIFLGTMTIPLLTALVALYGLRMWTEERHLAIDAEYRAYMKAVPWRVLPYRW